LVSLTSRCQLQYPATTTAAVPKMMDARNARRSIRGKEDSGVGIVQFSAICICSVLLQIMYSAANAIT
jgi:hypothetical protein